MASWRSSIFPRPAQPPGSSQSIPQRLPGPFWRVGAIQSAGASEIIKRRACRAMASADCVLPVIMGQKPMTGSWFYKFCSDLSSHVLANTAAPLGDVAISGCSRQHATLLFGLFGCLMAKPGSCLLSGPVRVEALYEKEFTEPETGCEDQEPQKK